MPTSNKLNNRRIKKLAQVKKTPFLVIDKKRVQHKFKEFRDAIGDARIFYAVKTNPHNHILKILQSLDADFEISSEEEMDILLRCGVSPQKIISSNPVKKPSFIKAAYAAGVNYFAFDSWDEVKKLSDFAPGSKVYVRLSVSNEHSQWPLSNKFGVETEQAVELLVEAVKSSLKPCGLTFHVGSQCIDETAWVKAIEKSRLVWDLAKEWGVELSMLNIGGGFPARHTKPIPSIAQIAKVIRRTISKEFPQGVELFVEPGRIFLGEAGVLVSTVIAKAKRNGQSWLYLDVGIFNGLMESIGNIRYPMSAERDGPASKWIIAGPSCDSFDVISSDAELPELDIGDKVYIESAGAYTTAYASRFNGFPIPKTYFV